MTSRGPDISASNAVGRLSRRGVVIFAVLIIVVLSALIGWTVLTRADAQMSTLSASMKRTQARAAAWSGIQAIMGQLMVQREALIGGASPELDGEVDVFAEAGWRGVARVIGRIEPEAARLNVNSASVEMLVASRAFDAARASAIAAEAASAPFGSPEDVPELADPRLSRLAARDDPATAGANARASESADGRSGTSWTGGDIGWTAVSADPNVQAGVRGAAGEASFALLSGDRRINLNQAWSEDLGAVFAGRLGPAIGQALKSIMASGRTFVRIRDVLTMVRSAGVGPAEWGALLDAITTTEDEYLIGRIDLTTATAGALACVPGIDADLAETLVRTRERLDAATLRSLAWPVTEGVLTPEQFERAVDSLTTRSLQWRVRIEAGIERAGSGALDATSGIVSPTARGSGERERSRPAFTARSASGGSVESIATTGATLEGRVVFEAVIDVASARPRLALFRDVTLEGPVRAWNATRAADREPSGEIGADRGELGSDSGAADDTRIEREAASGLQGTLTTSPEVGAERGTPLDGASSGIGTIPPNGSAEELGGGPPAANAQAGKDGTAGRVDGRVGRWRSNQNVTNGSIGRRGR